MSLPVSSQFTAEQIREALSEKYPQIEWHRVSFCETDENGQVVRQLTSIVLKADGQLREIEGEVVPGIHGQGDRLFESLEETLGEYEEHDD
jgi:hypothetical protein